MGMFLAPWKKTEKKFMNECKIDIKWKKCEK